MKISEEYIQDVLQDIQNEDIKHAFLRRTTYREGRYGEAFSTQQATTDSPTKKKLTLRLNRDHSSPPPIPGSRQAASPINHPNPGSPTPLNSGPTTSRTNRPPPPPPTAATTREALQSKINNAYDLFWVNDSAFLEDKISKINAKGFPELEARLERLKRLNRAKEEMVALDFAAAQATRFMTKQIISILLEPPNKALERKGKIIEAAQTLKDPKDLERVMKEFKRSLPEVYQMEADFFNNLTAILHTIDGTPAASIRREQNPKSESGSTLGTIISWFFFLGMIAKVVLYFSGE